MIRNVTSVRKIVCKRTDRLNPSRAGAFRTNDGPLDPVGETVEPSPREFRVAVSRIPKRAGVANGPQRARTDRRRYLLLRHFHPRTSGFYLSVPRDGESERKPLDILHSKSNVDLVSSIRAVRAHRSIVTSRSVALFTPPEGIFSRVSRDTTESERAT